MKSLWQHLRLYATKAAKRSKAFDEEGLDLYYEPGVRRPVANHRRPKLTKAAISLFFIDIILIGLLVRSLEPLITLLRRNDQLFRPQVSLGGQYIPETTRQQARQRIPRILHQTCANNTIPDKWIESQRSCREAHAAWEYKLWTDDIARDFLSLEYPWFLGIWDNYAFPIQRADSIRYFVLYHYGGMYLDMDTICNQTFPIHLLESNEAAEAALFKSTLPTGVTNDFMISTVNHPAFSIAISRLSHFYRITWFWARLLPYCSIMLSSGPLFLSLALKDYLLQQSPLPFKVQVIDSFELSPYITDLESCSWHKADAQALMWLGRRPWAWFTLGVIALAAVLYIINNVLLLICRTSHNIQASRYGHKPVKLS